VFNAIHPGPGARHQPARPLLSDKDAVAPTLKEAEAAGLLPSYAACQAFYADLRSQAGFGQ
jgi:dTDP-4-dehydrorhamnose 3,5-epimerase